MTNQHPLLIFPNPRPVQKKAKAIPPNRSKHPSAQQQAQRLGPRFEKLYTEFERTTAAITEQPIGIDPEKVLFLELKGTVGNFASALKNLGLEWLGEKELSDLDQDEHFFIEHKRDKKLRGQLFLTMTNRRCLDELVRCWRKFIQGDPLPRGRGAFKQLFEHLNDLSFWGPRHRLSYRDFNEWLDEAWADNPEQELRFHIELWYRHEPAKRRFSEHKITEILNNLQGKVVAVYHNDAIQYHALKVEAPINTLKELIDATFTSQQPVPKADLLNFDGIMYFSRPSACSVQGLEESFPEPFHLGDAPKKNARIALLDGLPLAGHSALADWILVDDPDQLAEQYQVREMVHGTAMASMILHGDLNDPNRRSLSRQLYTRPVMVPDQQCRRRSETLVPSRFPEDLIERAVVRMFTSTEQDTAAAPNVRVINLSLGDLHRPFIRDISAWARLIDYLSWQYKVLFIIAAGNQTTPLALSPDFAQASDKEKRRATITELFGTRLTRRILSPAESLNALCVGSSHADHTPEDEIYLGHRVDILPTKNTPYPSPITPIGGGLRGTVKPEIHLPGGRQLYTSPLQRVDPYRIIPSSRAPGVKAAAPGSETNELDQFSYSCGTSNAAALATHAAGHLLDTLEEVRRQPGGEAISDDHIAPILKAMLVHGAEQPTEAAKEFWETKPEHISTWDKKVWQVNYTGYGVVNVARVQSCTDQRATVIGAGSIRHHEPVHEFHLPLPQGFDRYTKLRRLTLTLAWLSPINPSHRQYYRAKLSMSLTKCPRYKNKGQAIASVEVTKPGVDALFNSHHTNRGTVQHLVYEGTYMIDVGVNDTIPITITLSKSNAGGVPDEPFIPYGLVASLEVGPGETIQVYQAVREALAVPIRIDTQT